MEESLNIVQRAENKLITELDNLQNDMSYIDDEEDMANEVFFKERTQVIKALL